MSVQLDKNLINLHEFWHAMTDEVESPINLHPSWPNKVWRNDFSKINCADWQGRIHVTLQKPCQQDNVTIKTNLTAMNLALENVTGKLHEQISIVKTDKELEHWCSACGNAFGYQIDKSALIPLLNNRSATILAFKVNDKVAGTAILYQTHLDQSKSVMGVHQVGVLPNFQGHGIGKSLMAHCIALAKKKDCKTMTLQASAAGLPMYSNMGFIPLTALYHLELKNN